MKDKKLGTLLADIRVGNWQHDNGNIIFEFVHVATAVGQILVPVPLIVLLLLPSAINGSFDDDSNYSWDDGDGDQEGRNPLGGVASTFPSVLSVLPLPNILGASTERRHWTDKATVDLGATIKYVQPTTTKRSQNIKLSKLNE